MDAKFKIGDLVTFNMYGALIVAEQKNQVGLIVSGPTNMLYSLDTLINEEEPFCYWAYDIMIGNNLITDMPQEFMEKIQDEENFPGDE